MSASRTARLLVAVSGVALVISGFAISSPAMATSVPSPTPTATTPPAPYAEHQHTPGDADSDTTWVWMVGGLFLLIVGGALTASVVSARGAKRRDA